MLLSQYEFLYSRLVIKLPSLGVRQLRVLGLLCGVVCVILCLAVLVVQRLVTDRQTDRQTRTRTQDRSTYGVAR